VENWEKGAKMQIRQRIQNQELLLQKRLNPPGSDSSGSDEGNYYGI
jgi:hypothetical protein